jgi:catechol 2,3-dioxygenase-like lactoylglutathione lyase family enzyme
MSVTDADRASAWYQDVFSAEERSRTTLPDCGVYPHLSPDPPTGRGWGEGGIREKRLPARENGGYHT